MSYHSLWPMVHGHFWIPVAAGVGGEGGAGAGELRASTNENSKFSINMAVPVLKAGRLPFRYFRGLLKLYSRYGLQSCSPPYVGFIARLRSARFPSPNARKLPSPTDNRLYGCFPRW